MYTQEFGKNHSKYWSNLMKIKQLGNIMPSKNRDNPDQGRVFDAEGLCPCLTSMQGGGQTTDDFRRRKGYQNDKNGKR